MPRYVQVKNYFLKNKQKSSTATSLSELNVHKLVNEFCFIINILCINFCATPCNKNRELIITKIVGKTT